MSVTLDQIYRWALNEEQRTDIFGRRHDQECAAGCANWLDACLSDPIILDRLKIAAKQRAAAAKAPPSNTEAA